MSANVPIQARMRGTDPTAYIRQMRASLGIGCMVSRSPEKESRFVAMKQRVGATMGMRGCCICFRYAAIAMAKFNPMMKNELTMLKSMSDSNINDSDPDDIAVVYAMI